MKKNGWADTNGTKWEYVFNLVASGSTGDNYGNLSIYSNGTDSYKNSITFLISSGSTNNNLIHDTGLADIADSSWHHYALTL